MQSGDTVPLRRENSALLRRMLVKMQLDRFKFMRPQLAEV